MLCTGFSLKHAVSWCFGGLKVVKVQKISSVREILAKSWHPFELAAFVSRAEIFAIRRGWVPSTKYCKVSYLMQRDHWIMVLTVYADYLKPYCSLKDQQWLQRGSSLFPGLQQMNNALYLLYEVSLYTIDCSSSMLSARRETKWRLSCAPIPCRVSQYARRVQTMTLWKDWDAPINIQRSRKERLVDRVVRVMIFVNLPAMANALPQEQASITSA